jgi:hypothetical protein
MKISKIASGLLVGGMLIIGAGCGSSSSSNNGGSVSTSSSTTPVKSYVLVNGATLDDGTDVFGSQDTQNYKVNFKRKIASDENVTITGFIDVNNNHIKDENDTALPFALKTKGATPFTNAVTTLAVKSGNIKLLEKAANFDPVKAVRNGDDNETKALLVINQLVVTVAGQDSTALEGLADAFTELNVSDNNFTVDAIKSQVSEANITTASGNSVNLGNVVANVENTVDTVVNLVQNNNLSDEHLTLAVTALMDSSVIPQDVADSLIETVSADINQTELNNTIAHVKEIDENISSMIPTVLSLTSIKLGDVIVPVEDINSTTKVGTFPTVTVNSTDKNLTDFYNVEITAPTAKIEDLNATQLPDGPHSVDANLTVTITNAANSNQNVSLKLENVQITLDKNATEPLKVTMNSNTTFKATQNGLNMTEISSGQTVMSNLNTTLTNTDLAFDFNTIIDNLGANQQKIKNTLDDLNEYFARTKNYNVNVALDVPAELKNILTVTELEGEVKVVNAHNVPVNHAPTLTSMLTDNTTGALDANTSMDIPVATAQDRDGDDLTCSVTGGFDCYIQNNGDVSLTGTVPSADTNVTLTVSDGSLSASQEIKLHVYVNPIPASADKLLEVNSSSTSQTLNDVTLTYQAGDKDIKVNFAAVSGNPTNSSATIVIKNSAGTVVGTISPDDRYNGKTFYITYDNVVKEATYDKDAANGEIDIQF